MIVFQNPVHFFASSGSHTDALLQLAAGASITFAGGLTTSGLGLFVSGFNATPPPLVLINGSTAADIGGTLTVNQVSDLGGDGTINATAVQINGGLRPGASADPVVGTLTIDAALSFGQRSFAQLDLNGLTPAFHDRVIGISNLSLSGTFHPRAIGGFDTALLEAGTTFDLFDWNGPPASDGGFGFVLDPTFAPLPSGLWWELSNLQRHGTFYVAPALPNLATGGTASASAGDPAENAFDGNVGTAWTNGTNGGPSGWLQYRFGGGIKKVVNRYTLISSSDASSRDPRDWAFQGSNDGLNWVILGSIGNRAGIVFANRGGTKIGAVTNTTAYEFYRLQMSENNGGPGLSLAELGLHYAPRTPAAVAPEHLLTPEMSINGTQVTLRVFSAAGRSYQLTRNSVLTPSGGENRGPFKTGTGDWLEFSDTLLPNETTQFYRVEIAE